ncbi:DUF2768 domain-containing protein [Exiguobacterium sp. A1_3_1]|uniref:DUF2768 domain-containing protein n=2 Tax=Bacillales Family XII. Incertae Sedis TaxID=539742 RepID=A0AAW3MBY0_9BACL|nr:MULTISPECIES: DUF2768 domain-containing protein [Exiguobacterium]EZP60900.1 putative membrane protein [Exiguobacterium sp. RIT341]KOP29584.1 membrane protein [Exiguobacterium sp. BMC-KP]AHA30034.1 hypothetical protein U719_10235 [Exiguobacterium sp. MH3]KTR26558.1 membrane protein [Exiguobacterium indicum]MCQ4089961.1 DUF2768 domain-containing protein [Exiguobacterium sp. LL15]
MWISFAGIGLFAISVLLVTVSRTKLKGIWQILVSTLAFVCFIVASIIMVFIVMAGPSA